MSASIYLCFFRIVLIYGSHLSRIKPKYYTFLFVTFDVICLILQAVGGAIASITNLYDSNELQLGTHIMVS